MEELASYKPDKIIKYVEYTGRLNQADLFAYLVKVINIPQARTSVFPQDQEIVPAYSAWYHTLCSTLLGLHLLVCNSIRLPCLLLLIIWLVLILYILGVLEARLAGVGLWGPGEKAFLQVIKACTGNHLERERNFKYFINSFFLFKYEIIVKTI